MTNSSHVILFITIGTGDLQPVFEVSGIYYRGFLRDGIRAFHQSLDEGIREYILQPKYHTLPEKPIKYKNDWFCIEDRNNPSEDVKLEAFHIDGNKIILTAPKIAPVIKSLKENYEDIVAVVILNTHRIPDSSTKQHQFLKEPFASGKILSKWLAEEFDLKWNDTPNKIGINKSGWVNILDGQLALSGKGKHHPINRIAVDRIDDTVRTIREICNGNQYKAILSTGGGMPEIYTVLKSCVQYRFESNYESIYKTEDSHSLEYIKAKEEPLPVTESFRVRAQASELIKFGDFTGAYASVQHLRNNCEESLWINVLQETKNMITGTPFDDCDVATLKTIKKCNLRCLITALRVEAGLWNKNWLEAINGTVTFYDQALRDAMQTFLVPKPISFNDLYQTMQFKNALPSNHPLLKKIEEGNDKYCLKVDSYNRDPNKHSYRYFTGKKFDSIWISVLNISPLETYNEILHRKTKQGLTLMQIRNQLTHGTVDREIIQNAIKTIYDLKLWSEDTSKWGDCFLNQRLIKDIFMVFNIQSAGLLYSDLVKDCLNVMSQHRFTTNYSERG